MATSKEISRYIGTVDIELFAIPLALRLLTTGPDGNDGDYYVQHSDIPGVYYMVVDIKMPIMKPEIVKGNVKAIRKNEIHSIPKIEKKMMSHEQRMYKGNKMYINPEHMDYISKRSNSTEHDDIKMGFIIIKGKGVITYVP